MSKLIAVVNMKGGVGKTTVAVSFAEASASMGIKTLLVDLDLQINASLTLVGDCDEDFLPWRRHHTIEDYLENRWRGNAANPGTYFLRCGKTRLLSGSPSLGLFERRYLTASDNVYTASLNLGQWMREILQDAKDKFDLIICDTPPGLSLLSESVIRMADQVIVPQVPDRLSTQGIQLYSRYLRDHLQVPDIAHRTNVFINRYSLHKSISKDYVDQIRKGAGRPQFPYRCFENGYTDSVLFKRPMDRSHISSTENIAFRELWGNVSDDVIAATRELWVLLGWIDEENDEPEPTTKSRKKFTSAGDSIEQTSRQVISSDGEMVSH